MSRREGHSSIRKRFFALIVSFALIFLSIAVYSERTATNVVETSGSLVLQQRELSWATSSLSETLQALTTDIYQSTYFSTEQGPDRVKKQLDKLKQQVKLISQLDSVQSLLVIQNILHHFSSLVDTLTPLVAELSNIQGDVELRYPAMPILLKKLQPTNVQFVTALNQALQESNISGNKGEKEAYKTLVELRYMWSQVISSVRVFVANRLGAFGPPVLTMEATDLDRKLYSEQVEELLTRLNALQRAGELNFIQAQSLTEMKDAYANYNSYFQQAANIFYSNHWRADSGLLEKQIQPLLTGAWTDINRLQQQINALGETTLNQSAHTTDTISNIMWISSAIILAILATAFVAFEYTIRRPIREVAFALEAEGKGEHFELNPEFGVEETDMLIDAFSNMKEQVRSRQLRLQTILDNAGEGIITLTTQGVVESFNKSAEILFGYTADEVIGHSVEILLPEGMFNTYKNRLRSSIIDEQEKFLRREHESLGRRKDGSIFPMSWRLGRFELEERTMFAAIVADISERKALLDRLTTLAERDSLTGLYNRHYLMGELERLLRVSSEAERNNVCLLYIDLDNFKFVNDTMGHIAGDSVLKEVTTILKFRARSSDLLARLGGDEFAIVLYDVDESQAIIAAEHYRKQLADYVFRYEGSAVDIGCSIGIAMITTDIQSREEILSRADLACHIAKRSGRNRVHTYKREDKERIDTMSSDMGWARRIKDSIENDGFAMALQPIRNMHSGVIKSYELLLRMRDTQGDLIMPSGFLPSAERFGLMTEVDSWVIKHSIRSIADRCVDEDASFSINLNPKSVGDVNILALIQNEIEDSGIDTGRIIFEVTESAAISNVRTAQNFLGELKALGFRTALDDFGVGYSSFSYLKDFPVDFVKIDGSFVCGIQSDNVKQAIVKSMNEVSHALGKQTIAEFVEDNDTFEFLQNIGVDFCQGYYIGEPELMTRKHDNVVYLS